MGTLLKTDTCLTSQNILYIKVAAAVLCHQTMIVSVLSMIVKCVCGRGFVVTVKVFCNHPK